MFLLLSYVQEIPLGRKAKRRALASKFRPKKSSKQPFAEPSCNLAAIAVYRAAVAATVVAATAVAVDDPAVAAAPFLPFSISF